MSARADADTARASVDVWLRESRDWAERALQRALPAASAHPARIDEAMRYAIFGGGKRLRPALVRLLCAHFGGRDADAEAPAVAVEFIHTYSLVHDDLPCMDDDDLRRGRPTCHKVYGEALAVLAGDGLLTLAFQVLARSEPHGRELCAILAEGAGPAGMVGGQVLDLEPWPPVSVGLGGSAGPAGSAIPAAATRVTRERVAEIHRLKTAALIAAATEMGASAAGAGYGERERARAYGIALGRCFQAVDDVLDVTGDAATLGKTPGKDADHGKPTLVAALGLDGARAEARRLAGEAERAASELAARPGTLVHDLPGYLLDRNA